MRDFGRLKFAITAMVVGFLSVSSWHHIAMAQTSSCSDRGVAFNIYFEGNKAKPTDVGLQVLDQGLNNVRAETGCEIAEVVVNGYQDTEGSDEYNNMLSLTMMVAIIDAFVERGVSDTIITGTPMGETGLAKVTGDGVREPLNRRVEIEIKLRDR